MPETGNAPSPNPPQDVSSALISHQLRIGAAVGGLLLLAITAFILWSQWNTYAVAGEAIASFQTYRATLIAMEKVSAERGPANVALSEEPPTPPADAEALRVARLQTDLALDQLAGRLDPAHCMDCSAERSALTRLRAGLVSARKEVDRLIPIPLARSTGPELNAAIDRMIAVVPQFTEIADAFQAKIISSDAHTLGFLEMARFAAMLRENAGLLGSRYTAPLAARRPLHDFEQLQVENAVGHIDQLHLSIDSLAGSNPALNGSPLRDMHDLYFGRALPYALSIRSFAPGSAQPLPTAAQFAAQYIPLMRPILSFRDEMLRSAEADLDQHRDRALTGFLIAAVLGAALISLQLLLAWLFRRNVIVPFVEATRAIVAIAADILPSSIQSRAYSGEVQSLFNAVQVLKAHSRERIRLEHERRGLIAELTVQAETDTLTGLLNRRAFESRARVVCSIPVSDKPFLAVIMFDIDHFKRINDTWGHPTGDIALKTIGNLCRGNWRKDDIVARVGGEEFAILIETHNPEESVHATERFRQVVANTALNSADGQPFSLTVSFGIAFALREHCPQIAALLARADEQLYKAKEGGRNRVVAELEGAASQPITQPDTAQ
jgi:diguanylate cyclase (GGDEF)-like protein